MNLLQKFPELTEGIMPRACAFYSSASTGSSALGSSHLKHFLLLAKLFSLQDSVGGLRSLVQFVGKRGHDNSQNHA